MKTVVKFDVPCNPWMNCKALLAGTAPALGNTVLSLGEICRWDCSAMFQLWMPEALPGLCVCQAATSQPGTEPGRTTPTPCPCTALGEIQEYQQNQQSGAFNRLLGVDSGGSRKCPKCACSAADTRLGHVRTVLSTNAAGWQVKARMFLCFCLPSRVSALSQPHAISSITLSLCLHAVWLSVACTFMLYCYTVQTGKVFCWGNSQYKATRKTPSKSHPEQPKRIQGAQNKSTLLTVLCE